MSSMLLTRPLALGRLGKLTTISPQLYHIVPPPCSPRLPLPLTSLGTKLAEPSPSLLSTGVARGTFHTLGSGRRKKANDSLLERLSVYCLLSLGTPLPQTYPGAITIIFSNPLNLSGFQQNGKNKQNLNNSYLSNPHKINSDLSFATVGYRGHRMSTPL